MADKAKGVEIDPVREKLIELMFVGQVLADAECDKQAECNKCPYNAPNACRVGFIADHLIANGVTVQKLDGCNYCKSPIYVKTIQYLAPVLAPMTRTEELRQQLYNLTGEVYLELPKQFCPMCGRKLPQPPKGE